MFYITQPCGYQLVAILAGGRVIQPPVPSRYIRALQVGIFGLRYIDEAASLIGALCAVCTSNTFIIKIPITAYFDAWMYERIYLFNTPTIVVT